MAPTEKSPPQPTEKSIESPADSNDGDGPSPVVINASGHKQELDRNFSLLSIASVGIVTGSEWPALGGSILVAIYNGGAPGVIFEFLVVTFFYMFVFASIAELASSIPSSAGVYHWASVGAGPRFGKACGFFAGWWNFFAWALGAGAMSSISGNIIISMWAIFHDDYVFHPWHVFVIYLIVTWMCCCLVAFANKVLPYVSTGGLFFILIGFLVTLLVCAILPSSGGGYASNSFVWTEWSNLTGYNSDGFVFILGMLNGAFAVGTPDVTTHLSEELPNPRVNVPKAMLAQLVIGTITAFAYAVVIFYSISDLNAVLEMTTTVPFPVAAIYQQATHSKSGAVGLLFLLLMPIVCTLIGAYLTAGRILFTLARDNATPYSGFVSHVSSWGKNPMNATLLCGVFATLLGCIYVGSITAFNALIGSFVLLSSLSYIAAILPNLITKRRYISAGPFALKGVLGIIIPMIACAYIAVTVVIFCFPYVMPVSAANMNYAVVITGGLTVFIGLWYIWKRSRGYEGPLIMHDMGRQLAAGVETKHGEILLEAPIQL